MHALRHTAVASVLLLGFGAAADAQTVRPDYAIGGYYDQAPLVEGRSAYVNRAPQSNAEADQIVMGLRVPYGPRYR